MGPELDIAEANHVGPDFDIAEANQHPCCAWVLTCTHTAAMSLWYNYDI
jgi:hypothetical protein